MVKTKIYWVIGIVLIIFSLLAGKMVAWEWFPSPGSPRTDWYDVEDWEVEVCSRGIDVPSMEPVEGSGNSNYLYMLTYSLQAQETELYDSSLYEVSYYFEPITGNVTLQVFLDGPLGYENVTGELVAKPNGGQAGYVFIEGQSGRYPNATIEYSGVVSGVYRVSVIKNEEEE